ncbi:MAG: D-alanyl-D-alanine carboxypeptidase, partial [Bacteroidales bacterium]|nr:D-alanyl-D-alanine carboxypeptidase [Bacteroidales bacterium]
MRFIGKTVFLGAALCLCITAAAQRLNTENATDYLKQQIDTNENLQGVHIGVKVYNLRTGETVYSLNEDKRFVPASTIKTLCTGAALLSLGPDYRFKTTIAYDGFIDENGTLQGNLYIVGGADPTLGSRKKFANSLNEIYARWAEAISKTGIRKIAGSVIGDDRLFCDTP